MGLAEQLDLQEGEGIRLVNVPQEVHLDLPTDPAADAVLAFAHSRNELAWTREAVQAAQEGRKAWIAYPKKSRIGADLDVDVLADLLREQGVRPARQTALGGGWSAVRFERA